MKSRCNALCIQLFAPSFILIFPWLQTQSEVCWVQCHCWDILHWHSSVPPLLCPSFRWYYKLSNAYESHENNKMLDHLVVSLSQWWMVMVLTMPNFHGHSRQYFCERLWICRDGLGLTCFISPFVGKFSSVKVKYFFADKKIKTKSQI